MSIKYIKLLCFSFSTIIKLFPSFLKLESLLNVFNIYNNIVYSHEKHNIHKNYFLFYQNFNSFPTFRMTEKGQVQKIYNIVGFHVIHSL